MTNQPRATMDDLHRQVAERVEQGEPLDDVVWEVVCETTTNDTDLLVALYDACPDRSLMHYTDWESPGAMMQSVVMGNLHAIHAALNEEEMTVPICPGCGSTSVHTLEILAAIALVESWPKVLIGSDRPSDDVEYVGLTNFDYDEQTTIGLICGDCYDFAVDQDVLDGFVDRLKKAQPITMFMQGPKEDTHE